MKPKISEIKLENGKVLRGQEIKDYVLDVLDSAKDKVRFKSREPGIFGTAEERGFAWGKNTLIEMIYISFGALTARNSMPFTERQLMIGDQKYDLSKGN